MKKILLILTMFPLMVFSQITIMNETFGNPTTSPIKVEDYKGWSEKNGIVYSSKKGNVEHSVEIRNNQTSEYLNDGILASGGGNLYLNGDATSFVVSNINASNCYKLKLSFGLFGKTVNSFLNFKVYYSLNDGTTKTLLKSFESYVCEPKKWQHISEISLPEAAAVSNLTLIFDLGKTEGSAKVRLDDIKIVGLKNQSDDYASLSILSEISRFETTVNSETSQNLSISGSNIASDVTLQLKDGSDFSLSKNTITAEELNDGAKSVSIGITYSPKSVKYSDDTLVINTANLSSPLYVLLEGKSMFENVQNLQVSQVGANVKISWDAVPTAENYLITINKKQNVVKDTIFYEDFSDFQEKTIKVGEKDVDIEIGESIINTGTNVYNGFFKTAGWTGANVYNGSDDDLGDVEGVCRLGKKAGGNGWLNSPSIYLMGKKNVYLSYKIRTFTNHGTPEKTSVKVGYLANTDQKLDILENLYPDFQEYIKKIENDTIKIRFAGTNPKANENNRFIIDDIVIFSAENYEMPKVKNKLLTENSFEIADLTIGAEYEISVRAYNPTTVFVSDSANVTYKVKDCSALKNISEENEAIIYAENGIVFIESLKDAEINIYNPLGAIVCTKKINEGVNEIVGLTQGVYLLQVGGKTTKTILN